MLRVSNLRFACTNSLYNHSGSSHRSPFLCVNTGHPDLFNLRHDASTCLGSFITLSSTRQPPYCNKNCKSSENKTRIIHTLRGRWQGEREHIYHKPYNHISTGQEVENRPQYALQFEWTISDVFPSRQEIRQY